MGKNVLAPSLSYIDHIEIFEEIFGQKMNLLEIDRLLVYIIDTCPSNVLPVLAEQFDILGYGGWKFATSDVLKRKLLKSAIKLKKYRGTPWSVIEGLKAIGYFDVEIIEGLHHYYDGAFNYTGENIYGGEGLFYFKVVVDIGDDMGINDNQTIDIIGTINYYKNVRSWLLSLTFKKTINERLDSDYEEDFNIIGIINQEETLFLPTFVYDGNTLYDGSKQYNSGYQGMQDEVFINVYDINGLLIQSITE